MQHECDDTILFGNVHNLGPTGPTGLAGSASLTGATGSSGPTGPTGRDGQASSTGASGPSGATGATGFPEDRGRLVPPDFREGLEPLVPLERQDQVALRGPLAEMACKGPLVPRVLVARQECRVEQAATRRVPRDPLDSQGPPVVPIQAPPARQGMELRA